MLVKGGTGGKQQICMVNSVVCRLKFLVSFSHIVGGDLLHKGEQGGKATTTNYGCFYSFIGMTMVMVKVMLILVLKIAIR